MTAPAPTFPPRIVDAPLIAHRGASADAPENTVAAVALAARRGARWIETDVRLTTDGGLVMVHDETLDRTTSGTGPVAEATFDEIMALDAGAWFAPEFAGEPVPDLVTFLRACREHRLALQLELKLEEDEEEARIEALVAGAVASLRSEWPIGERGLFVSSFSERALALTARALPEVPRAFATEAVPDDPAGSIARTGCQILHVQAELADDEALSRLASSGIEFAVATVNSPVQARKFLTGGATSVLSDIPDLV